jgi:energy-coupling factor transporter ATP-binding protein EcfA2
MEDKTIYTADNTPIPYLEKTSEHYIDKTTFIFGGTGSGKTTIIEEILRLLSDLVPNYIVVAPKTSDKAYREKLPSRCIRDDLTKKTLQTIWKRQLYMTEIYNMANDINILHSCFMKTGDLEGEIMIKAIKQKCNEYINIIENNVKLDFSQKKSQKGEVEKKKTERIREIYKNVIRKNKSFLLQYNLDAVERIAIEYMDFNPRLMLVIDDCSEKFNNWMKMFKKNNEENIFESILYKGRHNYITLIIASHDDKLIAPELRKNARLTIYCSSVSLIASMAKSQSGYTSIEKKDAMKMAPRIFIGPNPKIKCHNKFVYERESPYPFKYTVADIYPDFDLGCEPLKQLIKKLPNTETKVDENPYIRDLNKKY